MVVLPAPLGPRKPTTLPRSTVKVTWSTAVRPAKRLVSPSTSITAMPTTSWRHGDGCGGP